MDIIEQQMGNLKNVDALRNDWVIFFLLALGWRLGAGSFECSPGDANVQPGLKTTGTDRKLRLFIGSNFSTSVEIRITQGAHLKMHFPGLHPNSVQAQMQCFGLPFEKHYSRCRMLGSKISGYWMRLDRFHGKWDMSNCLSNAWDSGENCMGK